MPAAIWVLTAGTFLMGTSEFVVAGILPEVASDLDVSVAHAGLAITVFAVGMIIGAPTMALLTLRLPRKTTMMLALAVFTLGHVGAALTDSFALLLVSRFVSALATGAFWAVAAVVASHVVSVDIRSRALGIVLGGGMLANVVGVPLGAFGGQVIGWRGPFWGLAVLAASAVVAVAAAIPAERTDRAQPSARRELASLRSGRLWLTLAACAGVNAGVLSVYSYISPLLTDRTGISSALVPVALLLFGAGALIGSVLGGRAGDRRPFGTALVTTGGSLVVAAGLTVFADHVVPTFVLVAVLGLVGLSANPVLVSLAVGHGGVAPTLPSAMATSMFNAGTAIGTAITACLIGTDLGPTAAPITGIVFAAVTFIPLVTLRALERKHDRARRPPSAP
ncbi:MFS transporter [Curtobacterium pusillum]|uniref:MFS transporter n=1 Tax=Curtobacterium pusillum TaxID=69373 RepID=UPI0020C7C582|nr:MFS transporter [Curtobacterium pusillum]GLK31567.1 MFS transporter [Curtobacterium pusillum]